MRPGQTAPEFRHGNGNHRRIILRFNEAGADCPGIPLRRIRSPPFPIQRFNEAGADCPGIRPSAGIVNTFLGCFNEAGADCPGIPPPGLEALDRAERASMRPGQTAPEFPFAAAGAAFLIGRLQ